jgi:hypothetical protein
MKCIFIVLVLLGIALSADNSSLVANGNDVYLNVKQLEVDNIYIGVKTINASVALSAQIASLVNLQVGVQVSIEKVVINITGVRAKVELAVNLTNVQKIVSRALTTIDKNPQILNSLLKVVDNLVGGILNTVQTATGALTRLIDPLGNVIERTLDAAGNVLGQTISGTISSFNLVSSTVNTIGQTVNRLKDPASGTLVDVVYSALNTTQIVSVDVVQ